MKTPCRRWHSGSAGSCGADREAGETIPRGRSGRRYPPDVSGSRARGSAGVENDRGRICALGLKSVRRRTCRAFQADIHINKLRTTLQWISATYRLFTVARETRMARKVRWVLDCGKEEIWRRWRNGTPLRSIGRALNRRSAVIRKVVVARDCSSAETGPLDDQPRDCAPRWAGGIPR